MNPIRREGSIIDAYCGNVVKHIEQVDGFIMRRYYAH